MVFFCHTVGVVSSSRRGLFGLFYLLLQASEANFDFPALRGRTESKGVIERRFCFQRRPPRRRRRGFECRRVLSRGAAGRKDAGVSRPKPSLMRPFGSCGGRASVTVI